MPPIVATDPASGTRTVRRAGRALSYFARRYVLRRPYLMADAPAHGLQLRFKAEDAVGRHIYKHGTYESELTDYIAGHVTLRPGDVVVDAGANIGWYSLLLGRMAPPGVALYAFEPDPLNHELLVANLRINECENVLPVAAGLADADGMLMLHLYPDKNRGRHSFLPLHAGERVEVPVVTLDGFWQREGLEGRPLRFLKVDVEGFEAAVLRGGERTLGICEEVLTEYSPDVMRRAGLDPGEMLDLLLGAGLTPALIDPRGIHHVTREALLGMTNVPSLLWRRTDSPAA